jgi:Ca2+:H+ antiporter
MMVAEKPALGFQQAHAEGDEHELELELASPAGSPAPPPRKMHSLDFEHIGSLAAVAESLAPGSRWRRALTSVRVVIFQAKINVLLPFGPLAIMLHYLSGTHVRTSTGPALRFQILHFLFFFLSFRQRSAHTFSTFGRI